MGEATREELTTDEFVFKVKDLLENDQVWNIMLDIDRDRIKIAQAVLGTFIIFWSQALCQMPNEEYVSFRKQLDELMPEPNRELGRFW